MLLKPNALHGKPLLGVCVSSETFLIRCEIVSVCFVWSETRPMELNRRGEAGSGGGGTLNRGVSSLGHV